MASTQREGQTVDILVVIAAHVLGYVRKISAEQYSKDQKVGEKYYNQNDYVGVTGLEKVYEKELRGERGSAFFLRDYAGNDKTNLEENYAISGQNLYTSIDINLQVLRRAVNEK